MAINDVLNSLDDPSKVPVIFQDGVLGSVPRDQLESFIAAGRGREAHYDEVESVRKRVDLSGTKGEILAGLAGAARGATFGLSDVALTKSGAAESETLRILQEENPTASIAGEITGAVAPLLIPGTQEFGVASIGRTLGAAPRAIAKVGVATEKALAQTLARQGVEAAVAKGLARSAPKIAGSMVEGAFYGAGHVVSEDALGRTELTAEELLAGASTGALFAGVATGGFAAIGEATQSAKLLFKDVAAGSTLKEKATNFIRDFGEHRAVKALMPQKAQYKKLTSAGKYEENINEMGDWLLHTKVPTKYGPGGNIVETQPIIGKLDDLDSIKEKLIKAKEIEGKKIGKALDELDSLAIPDKLPRYQYWGESAPKNFSNTRQVYISPSGKRALINPVDISNRIEHEVLKGLRKEVSPDARNLIKRAEDFKAGIESKGDIGISLTETERLKRELDKYINYDKQANMGKLSQVGDIDRKIRNIIHDEAETAAWALAENSGKSDLYKAFIDGNKNYGRAAQSLDIVDNAILSREARRFTSPSDYGVGGAIGLGSAIVGSSVPAGFIMGVVASQGHKIFRERGSQFLASLSVDVLAAIEKSSNGTKGRIGKALDQWIKVSKGAELKGRAVAPLSVKIMQDTSYETKSSAPKDKQGAYKQRLNELSQIIQQPEIMTERLAKAIPSELSKAAPRVAQQASMKAMQAATFLYNKAPKRPGVDSPLAYDWHPKDSDISKWSRYFAAVEDPVSVIEDMSHGIVSREGVEVLREVYPELYTEIRLELNDRVGALREKLPYKQRLQLSVLWGVPVEALASSESIAMLQATNGESTEEPGSSVKGKVGNTFSESTQTDVSRLEAKRA